MGLEQLKALPTALPLPTDLQRSVDHMTLYLQRISEGRGPYSRDQLTFAGNCVEESIRLAKAALDGVPFGEGE